MSILGGDCDFAEAEQNADVFPFLVPTQQQFAFMVRDRQTKLDYWQDASECFDCGKCIVYNTVSGTDLHLGQSVHRNPSWCWTLILGPV